MTNWLKDYLTNWLTDSLTHWLTDSLQLFMSHLPRCFRTRRFSERTFRPSRATKHRKKNIVSRHSYLFAHLHLLTSVFLHLWSSHFWLAFPSVHIVGSLASRLPSATNTTTTTTFRLLLLLVLVLLAACAPACYRTAKTFTTDTWDDPVWLVSIALNIIARHPYYIYIYLSLMIYYEIWSESMIRYDISCHIYC